jgi:acyl carrier protein
MYGITETTVHVTFKEITSTEIIGNISNVGVPLPTLYCCILDKDLQLMPAGIIGELCVGGEGLARGYLNKPELTGEKFITNPWNKTAKLYRSGDYARLLPSGEIEYIGRRDDQVKIRGHRIELAEVAIALKKLEPVTDAIVLPYGKAAGEQELAAYFIADVEPDQNRLREQLGNMLPSYMVPSYLVRVPFFPVNSNGKLDKPALPDPAEAYQRTMPVCGPRNTIDEQLIAIWEEILERRDIGIDDNFFTLGGHSLKATRVISKIFRLYGIKMDMKMFFHDPVIRHLSDYIKLITRNNETLPVPDENEEEMIF